MLENISPEDLTISDLHKAAVKVFGNPDLGIAVDFDDNLGVVIRITFPKDILVVGDITEFVAMVKGETSFVCVEKNGADHLLVVRIVGEAINALRDPANDAQLDLFN